MVVDSIRELARVAEDHGVVLALQNHGPDIVNNYRDVLSLIEKVGSPAFKACMDINIEEQPESPEYAREMVRATGDLLVHSHVNGEFVEGPDGAASLAAAGYFDGDFWGRRVVYPDYFDALSRNPRVQLTAQDESMPNLYFKAITENTLTILGGVRHGTVHWVVTAERDDPKARLDRIARPVEQPKSESGLLAKGTYVDPDAYGRQNLRF